MEKLSEDELSQDVKDRDPDALSTEAPFIAVQEMIRSKVFVLTSLSKCFCFQIVLKLTETLKKHVTFGEVHK